MSSLSHVSPPPFEQGTILLAVNPLKAVPSPSIESFMEKPLDPETPHPYAIAEVCMCDDITSNPKVTNKEKYVMTIEAHIFISTRFFSALTAMPRWFEFHR